MSTKPGATAIAYIRSEDLDNIALGTTGWMAALYRHRGLNGKWHRVAVIELPPGVTDEAFDAMTPEERLELTGHATDKQPTPDDLMKLAGCLENSARNLSSAARKIADAAERAKSKS